MTTREQLKQWFSNLKKPNQSQFWAWLDSFFHKEDKIPMGNIEGLDAALQDTASDAQFQAHLTDNQAHSDLFAQKVDKEAGKSLSANDYSDEEKEKVHNAADKVIVSGSVTGEVNKILTLTAADGSALKIPFKDLGIESVADIMLNSLNFNHETGVLTGLRSDGQQLTVNLDGRYALIAHTHSYNDLEDKPELLPEAPSDGKQYVRKNEAWSVVEGQTVNFIDALPQATTPNAHYYRKNPNGKVDAFVTDNTNVLKQLNSDIPENLLRRSALFTNIVGANTNAGAYSIVTQWGAQPVVYGVWQTGEWGVCTRSIPLANNAGGMTTKNLVNKKITVSVDVRVAENFGSDRFVDTGGIEIGLGFNNQAERPFTITKADGWVRIYTTIQGDRLPGIVAKFKNPQVAGFGRGALTSAIYFKNWKISEVEGDIFYVPSWSDFGDSEVHFVKTYQMSNSGNFSTEELVDNQIQDGKHIGLSAQHTTLTLSGYRRAYKTRYIFLRDNSSLTLVANVAHYLSNSLEDNNKIFRGNRGDYVEVEYILDERNQTMVMARVHRMTRGQDAYDVGFAVPIASNVELNASHVGRVLQFNNATNINVNISGLPAGATVSGVKNNSGTITFTGTTAPTTDNVLNGAVNSSFSLVKNASGVSNLLISNK